MAEQYFGLHAGKPVFEGLSRYRQPSNFELAGRAFKLVMDTGSNYFVNFVSGTDLEWTKLDSGEVKHLSYECAKTDDSTFFVNFEYPEGSGGARINPVLILDFEQRLVTIVRTKAAYDKKYPTMTDAEYFFGAIGTAGSPLPSMRHSFTKDLVGKRIHWHYAPDVEIIHVYYSDKAVTIDFPKHIKEAQTLAPDKPSASDAVPSEDALDYTKNGYDEPAAYIKIKKNLYAVCVCEQNKARRGLSGNSLLFLIDTDRVHDVGRSFGNKGDHVSPENYMFAAYGDFAGDLFMANDEAKKEEYFGLGKKKPDFEGLSRYRQPFNYELARKAFKLVMDTDCDYWVKFVDGHTLEWGEADGQLARYHYECAKADETTYFVNFELTGAKPRAGYTLILDMEQRLVTLNKTFTEFTKTYPLMVDSVFVFGAIDIPGYAIPKFRHGFTSDLVGKRIMWTYSPDFCIIHVYYSPFFVRADFPPGKMPEMTPEQAEGWAEHPYDEKANYIKIKRNIYALSIIEQNYSKAGGPGNSLYFLMDLERVHDVGRSFGHRGNTAAGSKTEGENYMFAAYGDFVASDGKIEAPKSIYLPE